MAGQASGRFILYILWGTHDDTYEFVGVCRHGKITPKDRLLKI
jgi:hypothetical protein